MALGLREADEVISNGVPPPPSPPWVTLAMTLDVVESAAGTVVEDAAVSKDKGIVDRVGVDVGSDVGSIGMDEAEFSVDSSVDAAPVEVLEVVSKVDERVSAVSDAVIVDDFFGVFGLDVGELLGFASADDVARG